jgi:lipid-A-disaccharide synthase-like uncharacterized protein
VRGYHWLSRAATEDWMVIGLVGATAGCGRFIALLLMAKDA